MSEIDRFSDPAEWVDLAFVEQERTPDFAIRGGTRPYRAPFSLSNTTQYPERVGLEYRRTAIRHSDPTAVERVVNQLIATCRLS